MITKFNAVSIGYNKKNNTEKIRPLKFPNYVAKFVNDLHFLLLR